MARPLIHCSSGLANWFLAAAEPRAYAAVRFSVGVSAAAIWLELWPLRRALFSDAGLFGSGVGSAERLNVFALGNSPAAVDTVFIVALLAIACLLCGVFSRIAAVTVYLWAISYSAQAPISLAGYDTVLRLTSFGLAVSPTVAVWSVRKTWFSGTHAPVPCYGLRILQWQLMLIYWCTVWLKAPDPYWRQGNVMSYFWMSNFARFPTPAAASLGPLDALLTWGTLAVEAALPVLLWQRKTRFIGLGLGFCLHVGIALTAKLALFTLAMIPLYAAFLERQDFDSFAKGWAWVRSWRRGA